jgi:hypothetical protein
VNVWDAPESILHAPFPYGPYRKNQGKQHYDRQD